ncbi:PIN domain-containing protein [Kitasatospora aureofaciens]|uniref:PIN domain-containing protein n=1 Tax=Kitasatospora aureofaciens TaxID=1894 RepID=UPI00340BB2F0
MIILDSNILKGISLKGADAELLRAIRASGAERIAVPWIVMEELAAQQALSYAKKYEDYKAALNALRRASPWGGIPEAFEANPEKVRAHWRDRYAEVAEVIKTSAHAYQQALFREANLLAPCKPVNSGKNKTGARDAAIWLTAVEYAREHPAETVYFVSNNTEDFGDGSASKPLLAEDIADIADRFILYTSLGDVLTKFGRETSVDADEVKQLLSERDVLGSIAQAARTKGRQRPFAASLYVKTTSSGDGYLPDTAVELGRPARAALAGVSNVHGYEIDGHTWRAADARWLITGLFFDPHRKASVGMCSWQTRVLVSPATHPNGATILRSENLMPVSPDDMALVPELNLAAAHDTLAALLEEDIVLPRATVRTYDLFVRTVESLGGEVLGPFHGDAEWRPNSLD